MDPYGIFYNPTKLLSYGRVYNFSVGTRSIGKSTGVGIHLLIEFVNKGRRFIYTRRTDIETADTCAHFFDDAVNKLIDCGIPIKDFFYQGGKYYLNGELCGYAIPLSTQQRSAKSAGITNVWWILYDEFMITPGTQSSYLGGRAHSNAEPQAMNSLLASVDRARNIGIRNEVRVIFLGNAGSLYNPFFTYFQIDRALRPDTKYYAPKGELFVVELTGRTKATEQIEKSNAYRLSSARERAYAFENKFADTLDGDDFIAKNPKGSRSPLINLEYDGDSYGVYIYERLGFLYVSHRTCDGRPTLALTTEDHRPNYVLMRCWHGHPSVQLIKEMYDKGCIRFEDRKCKMMIDFYLRYDV